MSGKNYDSIDLMKFIACLFVVAIHSDPLTDVSPLLNRLVSAGIGRLAVPLFFLTSSFFLFKGEKINLRKYLTRIGILYMAWFIISLPITLFNRFYVLPEPFGIKLFQFIKSFFFTSTFSGSWFLASCAFCTIVFYFLDKHGKAQSKYVVIICALIYFLCVLTSAWGKLFLSSYVELKNFYDNLVFWFAKPYTSIIVGMPYFALGYYLARNEDSVARPKIVYTLLFLFALVLEAYLTSVKGFSQSTDCYFMLLPCAYCVFISCLKSNCHIRNALSLRKTSTIVFFSQFIWLFFIEFVEWSMRIHIPQMCKFIIGLVLCLITSRVVIRFSTKFAILKYLY